MKPSSSGLLAVLLTVAASCTSYPDPYGVGSDDYVLATRESADGLRETYRLEVHSSVGDASLRLIREYPRRRPFLGFQLAEIDKPLAEQRGVKPYSGLLVEGVYPKSSAESAGILRGDVLVALDADATVYLNQVAGFEAKLKDDQQVTATVVRGQENVKVPLQTHMLDERVSDTQDIALDNMTRLSRPYAGVVLRGIPATWCERIWGKRREAVVVTSVVVGSPAWLAGIRGGDVIEEVDGAPCPSVTDLSARLAESGPAGRTMRWRLSRGPGVWHDATMQLADYSGETNVWVPLIFKLEDSCSADRWSIGPFGLLMSNRSRYVADTSVRAAKSTNIFSMLLGLFRVESRPDETEVRLLWIISFDT